MSSAKPSAKPSAKTTAKTSAKTTANSPAKSPANVGAHAGSLTASKPDARAPSNASVARPARAGARHWLLKTDPDSFPFEALWAAPQRTTGWSGVRNHLARNFLRDGMQPGDLVLVYHSSSDPAGVVGVARITSAARPDPTQFDPRDDHFDARSSRASPTWWEVDVQALVRCPRFLTLADLRAEPRLAGLSVLQKGQRLSVQPVEPAHFALVLELAGVRAKDLQF